jgi:Transmembrane domain of unknown function (DUF3566)
MAQTADDPVAQGDQPPAPTTFVASPASPETETTTQKVDVGRSRRARRPLSDLPPGPRRTRVEIRRIGIWSVFKFSLLFSFCGMLIVFLALLIIYLILQAAGALDSLERLLGYFVDTGEISNRGPEPVHINGAVVFTYIFLGGCLLAAVWSGITTVVALIYNLISDILGGIEVTLSESSNRFTR